MLKFTSNDNVLDSELEHFDFMCLLYLIFKNGTRFSSKFGAPWRHEIFLETKNKVSYMVDNLSLSIVV